LFLCEELLHCHVEWHLIDDQGRRRRHAEERRQEVVEPLGCLRPVRQVKVACGHACGL
jgi:hypothetical protein